MAGAVLLAAANAWWWPPAAVGLVISQALIVTAWSDAKYGSILNAILLMPVVVVAMAAAPWGFRATYAREVASGLSRPSPSATPVTEADVAHLPAAVQRYLHFVGAVGKPRISNYRVRFRGMLRTGPDAPWMLIAAEQQSFVDPPGRLFLVHGSRFGVPMAAFHRYVGKAATFQVRIASLLTVVDARGPEMTRGETVTLFNDMCLLAAPTLVDTRIAWTEVDGQTVRATFSNAGNAVTATLSFDESGALTNFVSEDCYQTTDGKTYERLPWSTPVRDWREFEGRKVPAGGDAIWRTATGEYPYARFETVDVQIQRRPRLSCPIPGSPPQVGSHAEASWPRETGPAARPAGRQAGRHRRNLGIRRCIVATHCGEHAQREIGTMSEQPEGRATAPPGPAPVTPARRELHTWQRYVISAIIGFVLVLVLELLLHAWSAGPAQETEKLERVARLARYNTVLLNAPTSLRPWDVARNFFRRITSGTYSPLVLSWLEPFRWQSRRLDIAELERRAQELNHDAVDWSQLRAKEPALSYPGVHPVGFVLGMPDGLIFTVRRLYSGGATSGIFNTLMLLLALPFAFSVKTKVGETNWLFGLVLLPVVASLFGSFFWAVMWVASRVLSFLLVPAGARRGSSWRLE